MGPKDVYGCRYRVQSEQDRKILNAVCDEVKIWNLRGAYFTEGTYGCNEEEFALCLSYSAKVIYQFEHHSNPHCVKCMRKTNKIRVIYNRVNSYFSNEGYTWDITYAGDQRDDKNFHLECSDNYEHDCYYTNVITDTPSLKNTAINNDFVRCIFEGGGSLFIKIKNSSNQIQIDAIEESLLKSIGFRINLRLDVPSSYYQVRNADKVFPSAAMAILRANSEQDFWKDFEEIVLSPLDERYHSSQYGEDSEKMFQDGRICIDSQSIESSNTEAFKAGLDCVMSHWTRQNGLQAFDRNNSIVWITMTNDKISYRASKCNHVQLRPRKEDDSEKSSSAIKTNEPLTFLFLRTALIILFTWLCI